MSNSFVQVAVDGAGKLLQTFLNTISGNSVHAEGVVIVDTAGVAVPQRKGGSAAVSVTRPANATPYTTNDVVGATAAAISFPSLIDVAGDFMINSVSLELDASALISGEAGYNLYLYSATPPSALADNAAFDIPSGDRSVFLDKIFIGTPIDEGSTLFIKVDGLSKIVTLTGTGMFGYLVTVGAYTPTSARVHVVTLHGIAL